jgi:hypothetical protein
LRVHHTTVSRVLLQAGLPRILQHPRRSTADPFLPFIRATLERFPTLTASRLYAMVRERGYAGGRITSAISSPAIGRGRRRKPICACAACPASRRRSIGAISAI